MTITVTFDPPLPSDSTSTFNTKAFATLGDLNDWSTEANALATTVNAAAVLAEYNSGLASSYAGMASTAATAASTSASNAATSETNAGNSASSALAAYDSFDDRYLGSKSSAPTLDNDGAALLTGAMYWNSTASQMYVYTGSTWAALNTALGTSITASGASPALTITQTGSGNALVVEDSASTDTTPFVIDANGRVIVGTDQAAVTYGQSVVPQVQMNLTGAAYYGVSRWAANSSGGGMSFAKSRGASIGTRGVVSSGDSIANILFDADDGTNFIPAASIAAAVDGAPGTNDMPGRLVFSTTADGASSPTERMRITSEGRVLIGTAGTGAACLRTVVPMTGATTVYGVTSEGTVQTDATSAARYFHAQALLSESTWTLANLTHYNAASTAWTLPTVTLQQGFVANSSLIGATNNYGFVGNIPSGTGRWNFYAAGTAANAFSGDVKIFGAGGLGYDTGSGGTVTQATNRTTGVTLNKTNGAITLSGPTAGSATWQTFTVTNSTVAATDVIHVSQKSGTDLYMIHVTNVAAGSFKISYATTGGTTSEQPVFNFAVIKAVTA
jgi:hypothetical protein